MNQDVLNFLSDILTGKLTGLNLRVEALRIYTELTKEKDQITYQILFLSSGRNLYILPEALERVKNLIRQGLKINAIKELRCNSHMDSPTGETPSLSDSKNFVESLNV